MTRSPKQDPGREPAPTRASLSDTARPVPRTDMSAVEDRRTVPGLHTCSARERFGTCGMLLRGQTLLRVDRLCAFRHRTVPHRSAPDTQRPIHDKPPDSCCTDLTLVQQHAHRATARHGEPHLISPLLPSFLPLRQTRTHGTCRTCVSRIGTRSAQPYCFNPVLRTLFLSFPALRSVSVVLYTGTTSSHGSRCTFSSQLTRHADPLSASVLRTLLVPLALSLENTQVDNRTTLQDQPRSSEEELKKELEGMGGSTTPRVSSAVSTTISTRISRNLLLLVWSDSPVVSVGCSSLADFGVSKQCVTPRCSAFPRVAQCRKRTAERRCE